MDDPVGTVEIADRAGVGRKAVDQWRARYDDFPEPKRPVGGRPAWEWSEVKAWLLEKGLGRVTD